RRVFFLLMTAHTRGPLKYHRSGPTPPTRFVSPDIDYHIQSFEALVKSILTYISVSANFPDMVVNMGNAAN
ncbi:MAG TPA: hypothetical protein PLW83_03895, partial [Deltaproteobacteria bacterium]|nr:hypothetical protein [Deltaproteobacteria bacterium]